MFQIILPICYASPQFSVLTNLFVKLCEDSLNEEYTYFGKLFVFIIYLMFICYLLMFIVIY